MVKITSQLGFFATVFAFFHFQWISSAEICLKSSETLAHNAQDSRCAFFCWLSRIHWSHASICPTVAGPAQFALAVAIHECSTESAPLPFLNLNELVSFSRGYRRTTLLYFIVTYALSISPQFHLEDFRKWSINVCTVFWKCRVCSIKVKYYVQLHRPDCGRVTYTSDINKTYGLVVFFKRLNRKALFTPWKCEFGKSFLSNTHFHKWCHIYYKRHAVPN